MTKRPRLCRLEETRVDVVQRTVVISMRCATEEAAERLCEAARADFRSGLVIYDEVAVSAPDIEEKTQ